MIAELMAKIESLRVRVSGMVTRSTTTAAPNDGGPVQVVQATGFSGEVFPEAENFQPYGFHSAPHPDADGVLFFPSGNREHAIGINFFNRQYRLTGLKTGEVALSTDEGDTVKLGRGNKIEIISSNKVTVNSPSIELGTESLEKVLKGETFQTLFNNHTHTGNLGVVTSPPLEPSSPADLSTVVKSG